ncbi:MAG: YihY/virulence factor BrkB family protein [Ignavibacteriae bacterium]|nr:YihY/virulence factor BrkB family protein [Ignavibacteriota bacterium]
MSNIFKKILRFFKRLIFSLPRSFLHRVKEIYGLLVQTIYEFADDKAVKMSAALSFYMIFSLSPLLIIIVAVLGFIFGQDAASGQIVAQIQDTIGKENAEVVQSLLQNVSTPSSGIIATIVGGGIIIFASAGIFVELKESLNMIWGVEPVPAGILGFLRNRAKSFVMVLIIMLLLFVTIISSTALSTINNVMDGKLSDFVPGWQYINIFLNYIMTTVLIAVIYKFLPDVIVRWRFVWLGALITALLLALGKYLIGVYMAESSYKSLFGAAGSLVIFMIWIYYSSFIFFFGAEFTQVYRNKYAITPLRTNKYALKVEKVTSLINDAMEKVEEKTPK